MTLNRESQERFQFLGFDRQAFSKVASIFLTAIGFVTNSTLFESQAWAQQITLTTVQAASPGDEVLIAQIIPDDTLGEESSAIIDDSGVDLIDGGAIRGNSLFHSFQEFNINTGQQVYFANPVGIENILSRVTGGNVSNIDGLLGVDGVANLFLLNPNGILFGPNAQLDIRGAFTASTASRFDFVDGGVFSAVNPEGAPFLTLSVPLGVQFNTTPLGDITSTGELETGEDLTLLGNQLYLEGQLLAGGDLTLRAQEAVTIRDTSTEAFVARSGNDLMIQGNQGIDIWTLQHLEQTPFISGGNLALVSDGMISGDAHFESGASLQFLTLAGTPGTFVSFYDPIIFADGDVVFGNYTGTALKVEVTGSIEAGRIRITGPDTNLTADGSGSDEDLLASSRAAILRAGVGLGGAPNLPQMAGGTTFLADTLDEQPPGSIVVRSIDTSDRPNAGNAGNGGAIILSAAGNITVDENLDSRSSSNDGDSGNGGTITVFADRNVTIGGVDSRSGQRPNNGSAGNGGAITISSTFGEITIDQELNSSSGSGSTLDSGSSGNGGAILVSAAGNISIDAMDSNLNSRSLNSGSRSNDRDAGNGGVIDIFSASGNIAIGGGSDSASRSNNEDAENGGDITITSSGDTTIGGELRSFSRSLRGDADDGGDITISTSGDVVIAGELESFSRSNAGDPGNGGGIDIASASGDITIDGNLDSFSLSNISNAGNGGSISLRAPVGTLQNSEPSVNNSSLSTFAISGGTGATTGNGGNIVLEALALSNMDIVTFASSSAGNSGDVLINNAGQTLTVNNLNLITSGQREIDDPFNEGIISLDENFGESGRTVITSTGDLTLNNVELRSDANRSTDAGDVEIISSGDVRLNNSQILSNTNVASSGNGGRVLVRSEGSSTFDNSLINTDTFGSGRAGSIDVQTSLLNLWNGTLVTAETNSPNTEGTGGDITIEADTLNLSDDNTEISVSTNGPASGGSITLKPFSTSSINIITAGEGPQISASTALDSSGTGGDITIRNADSITLDGGQVSTETAGSGRAGRVEILSSGSLQLSNSQILSNTTMDSSGEGGSVFVLGEDRITLSNSFINTDTNGSGRAGRVDIQTPLLNIQSGAQVTAETNSSAVDGEGGNVTIEADAINLSGNGTQVSVTTNGPAPGGSVILEPFESGDINIFTVGDGPQISASTAIDSSGSGGSITIRNAGNTLLSNTELVTSGNGSGPAGSIFIQGVDVLTMEQGSLILAIASDIGSGGNVDIDAGSILTNLFGDNDILATATSGQGGVIEITANFINEFREVEEFSFDLRGNNISDISASSESGLDGIVDIDADPDPDPVELPTNVIDPANQIARGCSAEDRLITDSPPGDFIITGRGGQPLSPTDIASGDTPLDDLGPEIIQSESANLSTESSLPTTLQTTSLADAQDAVVTESGEVFLVAAGPWQPSVSCATDS